MSGRQLELFGDGSTRAPEVLEEKREEIESYLAVRVKRRVRVVFTDNASTMIHVNRKSGYTVRLHHMFADAKAEVLKSLAVYLHWPRHKVSNARLSEFINDNYHLIKPAKNQRKIRTAGEVYDLRLIYNRVNARYFGGRVSAPITWGREYRGRRRRSIRFGSVDHGNNIIRINPALDAAFVPEFFLEYIVFHEMLHCLVETRRSSGRNIAHHADFRKKEKEFARYEEALAWQKKNLYRFLGKKKRR